MSRKRKEMDNSKTPIFDNMASDLTRVQPEYVDEILCPLCLGRFSRSAMRSLTKEHVLSKSLGGKTLTLSCKRCNHVGGGKIQGHLSTLLGINEGFRGSGDLRGKFTVFGETVPVGIRVRPGNGIAMTALGGSRDTLTAIEQGFRRGGRGKWSVQVNLQYSPGKASAAIARAAYLLAFEQFGYSYILSPAVESLRQEIIAAMDDHSDRLCALTGKLGQGPTSGENPLEAIIIPVSTSDGYKFLVAVMRFRRNRDYWMFCGLPNQDEPSESMFANLGKAVALLGGFDLKMRSEDGEIIAEFVARQGVSTE